MSGLSEGPATTHCSRQQNPLSQSRTEPPSPFKHVSHLPQRELPVLTGGFVEASRAQPICGKPSHKHPLKGQASGETVSFWVGGRLSWGQEGLREFGSWSERWQLAEGAARFVGGVGRRRRRVFLGQPHGEGIRLFFPLNLVKPPRENSPLQLHTSLVLIRKDIFT